mmetsp:Transcript_8779/g.18965  ORF Transcript_8779/g.18965 Transcript_8779/m.18965 type:complete len:363 (-) Transcript_8779:397-1485(-)
MGWLDANIAYAGGILGPCRFAELGNGQLGTCLVERTLVLSVVTVTLVLAMPHAVIVNSSQIAESVLLLFRCRGPREHPDSLLTGNGGVCQDFHARQSGIFPESVGSPVLLDQLPSGRIADAVASRVAIVVLAGRSHASSYDSHRAGDRDDSAGMNRGSTASVSGNNGRRSGLDIRVQVVFGTNQHLRLFAGVAAALVVWIVDGFLQCNEILLGMGADLGTRAGTNHVGNLFPIARSELIETGQEALVFVSGPPAGVHLAPSVALFDNVVVIAILVVGGFAAIAGSRRVSERVIVHVVLAVRVDTANRRLVCLAGSRGGHVGRKGLGITDHECRNVIRVLALEHCSAAGSVFHLHRCSCCCCF